MHLLGRIAKSEVTVGKLTYNVVILSYTEVIVRDKWAFEIAEVESTLTPVSGGAQIHAHSSTVIVLVRQLDSSWRVARVLALLST